MRRVLLALLLWGSLLPGGYAVDQPGNTPPPKVKTGDVAPDFTLTDQSGGRISLHDYRGKKSVVLAFYLFAFTGG